MTPLDLQLKSFFRSYISAFNAFDARAIASHFHLPSSLITSHHVIVLADEEDAIASFNRLLAQHKKLGYHHAKILKITRSILSEQLTQTKITWSFRREDNSIIQDFDSLYLLGCYEQSLKIATLVVP
jgi:hypothetical protein